MNNCAQELLHGERFEFGKNWKRFLHALNDRRIEEAERSLMEMMGVENLEGRSLLDIGSGSGLFSLAAHRLGARVHSFDYDSQSAACAKELKWQFAPNDLDWVIEQGSVLDGAYLRSLGQFDIVYSWGVLHHTGAMWQALENADVPVRDGGKLFISIYNDQGSRTVFWKWIKRTYNRLPAPLRWPFVAGVIALREFRSALICLIKFQPQAYIRSWTQYDRSRGMNRWHDLIDWIGGYPFEAARPEELFNFYNRKGYRLEQMKLVGGGSGCNQFVFTKTGSKRD